MESLLNNLTDFDISTGLAYADNDKELYIEVLAMFHEQLSGEFSELAALLAAPDDKVARQVHTLKGSASSVGAHRIEQTAAEVDNTLKKGNSVTSEQAQALDDAIKAGAAQLAPVVATAE
ncbi:Hpt domain-containing protein [Vreelandella massiliensis]|uniref:Hpt domain-containing protein n=1 Tax=Vreelandella massiliensis TaxID=1816686 RepID=UPI00096AC3D2|nr:Hpt domain-containing protein [Halomonas massiliensis]